MRNFLSIGNIKRKAVPKRTIRARQLDDGHFEFLEPVNLPMREFEVTLNEQESASETRPARKQLSPGWPMGDTGVMTRDQLYEDLT